MFIRALCLQLKAVGDGELQMEVDLLLFACVQAHMEWTFFTWLCWTIAANLCLVCIMYCVQLYYVGLQTPQ
jgi:hypothetical protein